MLKTDHIGIDFEFTGDYCNHFYRIFQNISVEKYTWYVTCSENYLACNGKIELFLPNNVYSGHEFASIISSVLEYYIHRINLYAVPESLDFNPENIKNYNDYMKSNAVIALICADSIVDFYSKDYEILKQVYIACEQYYRYDYNNEPFKLKTVQNDSRTGFVG